MYAERSETRPTSADSVEARAAASPPALSQIAVRGRSVLALVVAPEAPLDDWLAALDEHLASAPNFFAGRPVIADLSATHAGVADPAPVLQALSALAVRNIKLIGGEGIDPALLSHTLWNRLPTMLRGREAPREVKRGRASQGRAAQPSACSLIIDRPVRSGQSIVFEGGDVTVIGAVASGAEVVAGGSIHVEGALRGRAIAGVTVGETARIFCRRLEAELVAIAGRYRTAEGWGDELQGRPAQARCERGQLQLTALE